MTAQTNWSCTSWRIIRSANPAITRTVENGLSARRNAGCSAPKRWSITMARNEAVNDIEQHSLLRRIRWLVGLFIAGLLLSGATAIPLESEVTWLAQVTGARERLDQASPPAWAEWLCRVEGALREVNLKHPFIRYGGDWLAFGHFVIAIAF